MSKDTYSVASMNVAEYLKGRCVMNFKIRFIFISVVVYALLLIVGGGVIAVPLFSTFLGNNVDGSYFAVLLWGMILLAGYIAICTVLIIESNENDKAD